MSSKSGKSSTHKKREEKREEKRPTDGKKFAQIPVESILLSAEIIGENIGEEIAKPMAEDASYKLREVIHLCGTLLKQANRNCLTTQDVNEVLESMNVQPLLGHSGETPVNFTYIKEAKVFVEDDYEIDVVQLALSNTSISQKGNHFIKSMWLMPKKPQVQQTEPGPSDEVSSPVNIPERLMNYYKHAIHALLGHSKIRCKVLTEDFRTNSKVGAVLPQIVEVIAGALFDTPRSSQRLLWLLNAIEALADNTSVDLSPSLKVNKLVSGILHCALDYGVKKGNYISSDQDLRQRAAHILNKVLQCWCGTVVTREVLRKLSAVLQDYNIPLQVHRGALLVLKAMGKAPLSLCLWPLLLPPGNYCAFLNLIETIPDVVIDFESIKDVILDAAELLYREEVPSKEEEEDPLMPQRKKSSDGEQENLARDIQRMLYEQFGDTVCCRWPLPSPNPEWCRFDQLSVNSQIYFTLPAVQAFSSHHRNMKDTNGQCFSPSQVFEQPQNPLLSLNAQHCNTEQMESVLNVEATKSLIQKQCKPRNKYIKGPDTFILHSEYQKACSDVLWTGKVLRSKPLSFMLSGELRNFL